VTEPSALALAAVAVAALSFAAALRWTRWRTSAQGRRRARRGFAGQAAAARLLGSAGYAVVDAQPRVAWVTLQDGEPHTVELRGDYLVSRRGRTYLAEVKTGAAADSLSSSATRRQLLEYQLAFATDGVLLVCPERRTIHAIEFPALEGGTSSPGLAGALWLVAGAALGAAGSLLLLR
jgi:hypothetical protein